MNRVMVTLSALSVAIAGFYLYLPDDQQPSEDATPALIEALSSENSTTGTSSTNSKSNEQSDVALLRKQMQEQQQQIDLMSSQSKQIMTMLSDIQSSLATQSAASERMPLLETEAIKQQSSDERVQAAREQEQKVMSEFYMSAQNPDITNQISERISRGFLETPELLSAGLGNVDCRDNSCIVEITQPSGEITEDQMFEYQFHLSRVLGESGLKSMRYLPSESNSASGTTIFISTLAK